MDATVFKRTSRRLTLELIAVVCSAFPSVPTGLSAAAAWQFVGRHPSLVLHVVLGVVVLAEATVFLVRCVRAGRRRWTVLAAAGLALVLFAAVSGDLTVVTQRNLFADLMAVGWLGALAGYVTGWSLGRRQQAPARARPLDQVG